MTHLLDVSISPGVRRLPQWHVLDRDRGRRERVSIGHGVVAIERVTAVKPKFIKPRLGFFR